MSLVPSPPPAETLTYEPYFGLTEKPFSLNADPRFIYDSPTYLATFESLLAGIRRREGLLVLTGQIGTGKTTLCRAVLEHLGRDTYSSLVPDPFASREDLLKMLLIDFGVLSVQELTTGPLRQASRTELGYLLSEFLDSLAAGSYVVVVIDEAQNLSLPLIEETRILSDTFGAQGRLQILFVGQPELHAKLKMPEMRQVDQRICGYHRLEPMSREGVGGYIQHRLQVAGGGHERSLFSPVIIDILHRRCGGVPRLVNRVCDRALQLAYERKAQGVDQEILDTALIEVGAATLSPTWDSIMFAEPARSLPAAAPALKPAAAAAPAVQTASAIGDEKDFAKEVEQWVAQDLAPPPPRAAAPRRRRADEAPTPPATQRRAESRTAARREVPTGTVRTGRAADLRSETYLQRLFRVWAKRVAIALGAWLTLNAAMFGASRVLESLTPPPSPPVLPAAPVLAVPGPMLREAPPMDAALVDAPLTDASVGASADYLVAVGLFSNRERADQIVDALAQAGLPAMQRTIQLRRQNVQQIVLGPFFNRSEAGAALRRLQALGGYDDASVIGSVPDSLAQ